MRRQIFAAAAALTTMLALAGCGSGGGGTYPTNTVDPAAAVSEEPEPTEDPATEEPEPTEEPTTEEPTEAAPTPNSHGNLDKEIGEEARITDYDYTDHVKLVLTEMVPNFKCTADWADPPKNGMFLGLHFDVMTTQEFAESDWSEFSISTFELGAYQGDTRVNDVDGNSWMCLDDADALPRLGPGQHATGWVVIDVPTDVTSVQFVSFMVDGGWEWQVPQD